MNIKYYYSNVKLFFCEYAILDFIIMIFCFK